MVLNLNVKYIYMKSCCKHTWLQGRSIGGGGLGTPPLRQEGGKGHKMNKKKIKKYDEQDRKVKYVARLVIFADI